MYLLVSHKVFAMLLTESQNLLFSFNRPERKIIMNHCSMAGYLNNIKSNLKEAVSKINYYTSELSTNLGIIRYWQVSLNAL